MRENRKLLHSWVKKDFKLDWFSGSGAGGQHRNKHQNCLRLTHLDSGITTIGQNSRERKTNLKEALTKMGVLLTDKYFPSAKKERNVNTKFVRTYNEAENRVIDHRTGKKYPYKKFGLEKVLN